MTKYKSLLRTAIILLIVIAVCAVVMHAAGDVAHSSFTNINQQ